MSRGKGIKETFKKGKDLIDDLSDEIGDYLETGSDYLKRLGGDPVDTDQVVRNVFTNKFNRQADLEGVKYKKGSRKTESQQLARKNFYQEAIQRREQEIRDYIDEDYSFGKALELQQKIFGNTKQGQRPNLNENYNDFLQYFSDVIKNKTKDKKSYDKFALIYDSFTRKSKADALEKIQKNMIDAQLIRPEDIISKKDTINILKEKGFNMRGYEQGADNPGYIYTYVLEDIANVTENYRKEFKNLYNQEPIGRSFSREDFFKYLQDNSNFLKNYFTQVGYDAEKRISGVTGDLKEFKRMFYDSKNQFPDKIGQFDPGTEKSLTKPRASDYVADYIPGDVRWSDGSVLDKTSQGYKDIKNFKKQILEFVPQNELTTPINTNLDQQINRMINKQIIAGVDPKIAAENTANVLKNTNKKTMPQIFDLLSRKTKIQNRVQQARDKGLTTDIVDNISLAHVTDVADNYKLALDIDNLFLAPLQANQRQYNFYDKKLRDLQSLLASDNLTPGVRQTITDQVDDLGKQLEFEGIVTDVGYGRVGKARTPDEVAKMYDDQVDFYMAQPEDRLYTADMNERIKQGAQGPGFNEGGSVDEEPVVDEDIGILDYLSDKKKQFEDFTGITKADEALQNFVEEDLGGNPFRAVPVGISKILQVPGQIKDKFIEARSNVNEDLDQLAFAEEEKGNIDQANQIRSLKSGESLLGEFDNPITITTGFLNMMTQPLQDGYQNMFTDDDYFYNPITGDKFMADTGFKKAMAAGSTLGLTALEIMLAFNPLKISAIGKLPPGKMTTVLQTGADFLANAVPFIAAYETKEPNIRDLFGISEEVRNETAKIVEEQEQMQEAERDANVGVDIYNPGTFKAEGGMIGDELPLEFLENRDYAQTRLSRGGDPGQFTNPTSLALEEDFDARDILNEPGYESIEELDDLFDITKKENRFTARDDLSFDVASRGEGLKYILSNVPKWVREGKERIKMGVENILPGTREQPPGLPAVIDDTADGLTPLTKQEPGQIFYQQMEAELLQGPKVFKDKQAFFDYMQARNIGKVEVLDSEIERVIDSLTQKNMPITRETLIGVLRESPVRFVQSKGYGFLSDSLDGKNRSLKYSGYKEPGEIEGTSRERVLFVDPKDLRGDPGSVPGSVSQHNWEEPYTIAWSRLSDRDLGGKYGGKTVTFADEIQSDIFQGSQRMAGKLAAKVKYMADNNVPLEKIDDDIQRELLAYFGDRKHVFRESLPSAAALKQEYDQLMSLQDQLRELANTPVPDMTDAMIEAAKKVQFQQADVLDNLTQKLNLDLNRYLFPNLPFKLRGQWADASIKRDIYEAAYRKFVLKDPNATDYYAVTPANLVTKRYSHEGTTATPAADRAADKERRIQSWVSGGMEGDIGSSRYPGVGMYEFYGGPGADVVTESGKHYTSEIEKILKRIARENNVPLEVLPVRIGRGNPNEVFNVVDRDTGQILGTGNTGRQADAIANDIIANSDRKVVVQRAEQFDTADSFGIELTPSMAEAFKAYMAKGGYVNEEILLPYGD